MRTMASLNHINVVRTLGICPGDSLQLVIPLNRQGSLLAHVKKNKGKLSPQRLLNWCVQIAKVWKMFNIFCLMSNFLYIYICIQFGLFLQVLHHHCCSLLSGYELPGREQDGSQESGCQKCTPE